MATYVVGSLAKYRMQEIDATKGTSYQWKYLFATQVDHSLGANMGEYVVESKLAEGKLRVVCVRAEVFEAMEALAEASEGLTEVIFPPSLSTVSVHASEVDAAGERPFDVAKTRRPTAAFVRDVVLHPGV